ncbi:bifunctional helix-turn-helix transcriptional regulator/GNAT family N-acetyltransferase [Falsiroseomonas sp. HW251]|uniref:bifunctional helix-turn-helix transcriptional regulator/GNAT family N-acetyltransferase n=1 Tax=Falsiroseomonas sp. HW251 TaxID=3390998 RepID=UPI003D315AB2
MHDPDPRIEAVRRFSRLYTSRIGVLQDSLLQSGLSLTEGRVVFELSRGETTSTRLAATLGLDAGYLSRVLRALEARALLARRASEADGRQSLLSLSPEGRAVFAALDARSREEVGALLATLGSEGARRLVAALGEAERLLAGPEAPRSPWLLRPHRVGDMGWVVHRQAVLYAEEYGWNAEFEALLAEIAAAFIRNLDPARERCWIAERDGAVAGSVFLVKGDAPEVAKLRLLYVEPSARGLGIGARLVAECVATARALRYRQLTLWTNDVLVAARRIYIAQGFALVREERHHSFGKDLVGQYWALDL